MTSEQRWGLFPIESESTVSLIARRLRDAISMGVYEPGARLIERELAQQLGISRGPLREAMQRLVQEGLVVEIPNRGAFVKEYDGDGIVELFVARYVCESAAVRLFMSDPNRKEMRSLELLVEDLVRATHKQEWERAVVVDLAFHQHLVHAAGNPHLSRMFDTLRVETLACLFGTGALSAESHQLAVEDGQLLAAIASGDVTRATSLVQAQMADATQRLTSSESPLRSPGSRGWH